jgi:ubiquinone/menaquinone biosynthesis C-methylase UbiE
MLMGSGLRRWLSDPVRTLQGADIRPGQTVLEVGCGTGFFTVPAAQPIGNQGCLLAMDVLAGYLEQVSAKLRDAGLTNVRVLKRDALDLPGFFVALSGPPERLQSNFICSINRLPIRLV